MPSTSSRFSGYPMCRSLMAHMRPGPPVVDVIPTPHGRAFDATRSHPGPGHKHGPARPAGALRPPRTGAGASVRRTLHPQARVPL
jgi:hypothetical protein